MGNMILVQYAKWPQLGKVKTRIGRVLGHDRALEIHLELVQYILERFANVEGMTYQLWLDALNFEEHDPSGMSESLAKLVETHNVECHQQRGLSLGERMCHTFNELASNFQKVAIVGSDCPNVSLKQLREVDEALTTHDLVLIPAEDGGYVLIAIRAEVLSKVEGSWLEGVRWGSGAALEDTLSCCDQHGLDVHLLAESWDVDEVKDYERWKLLH